MKQGKDVNKDKVRQQDYNTDKSGQNQQRASTTVSGQKGNNTNTTTQQQILRVNDNQKGYYQLSLKKEAKKAYIVLPIVQTTTKLSQLSNLCTENQITYHTFKEFQTKYYDIVILFENELFYCKSESYQLGENIIILQIEGKLYSTELDDNYNPIYKIVEGKFSVNCKLQKVKLIEKKKEFLGKSNNVKINEKNEKQLNPGEPNKNKSSEFRSQSQAPSKIIIKEEGRIINNRDIGFGRRQFQKLKIWCKYNQQLNERDEQILKNKQWLTSSIIDSFVFYLNLQSENQYFKDKLGRKLYKRILFLPTSLTTNFGIQYDFKKAQHLFQNELLQFQDMNFELNKIYSKIGIPINKNNIHWQFLLFDYEKKQLELFDSLSYSFDNNLIQTLAKLLNLENCKQINQNFQQQQNGYACGYYVCTFMYHQYQLQSNFNQKYNYNEYQITNLLLDVIKDKGNQ